MEELPKKEAQHEAWGGALKDYGRYVTSLPTIIEQFGMTPHYGLYFSTDWHRACSCKQRYVQHCMNTLFVTLLESYI